MTNTNTDDQPELDFGECFVVSTVDDISNNPWFGVGARMEPQEPGEHYFHLGAVGGVYDHGEAVELREQLNHVTAALKWMTSERDRWRDAWKESTLARTETISHQPSGKRDPMANALRPNTESYGGIVLPDRFR